MEQKEIEVGESYNLEDIFYETNSAEILPESKLMLAEFAEYLVRNPSIKLAIHGHTDDVGRPEYNMTLAGNRCKAVVDYFRDLGLPPNRISWQGHGGTLPIAENTTSEGRQKNRRVEFILTRKE